MKGLVLDPDIVATLVVDDGYASQGGGSERLEREGAEEATGEHFNS